MSLQIDSSEVLKHLNNYGITSVENEALKLFIKDLKKLIKYELRKNPQSLNCSVDDIPPSVKFEQAPVHHSPSKRSRCSKKQMPNSVPMICCHCEFSHNCRKALIDQCHSEKSVSMCQLKNTPDHSSNKDSEKCCKCSPNKAKDASTEKCSQLSFKRDGVLEPTCRPASSASYARSQSTRKSKKLSRDPVELYQYYQSIWKQHCLPGENDHAQLRRSIRDRLMKVK